jgi:hypothetical protein
MSNGANTIYQQPKEGGTLIPEAIKNFCNGQDLRSKLNGAIRLSTVDEDRCSRTAIVSYRVSGTRYSDTVYLVKASLRMRVNPTPAHDRREAGRRIPIGH